MASTATELSGLRNSPRGHRKSRFRRLNTIYEALASTRPHEEIVACILREIASLVDTRLPVHLFQISANGDVFRLIQTATQNDEQAGRSAPRCSSPVVPVSALSRGLREALAAGEARICAALSELLETPAAANWAAALPEGAAECSYLVLPVPAAGRLSTFVLIPQRSPCLVPSTSEDLQLLAGGLAIALRQEQLLAQRAVVAPAKGPAARGPAGLEAPLLEANRRLAALNRVATVVAGDLDLEYVLEAVVTEAIGVVQADAVALFLPNETHEEYALRAQRGLASPYTIRLTAKEVEELVGATADAIYLPGAREAMPAWAATLLALSHTKALAVIPLRQRGRLSALLVLLLQDAEAWRQPERQELAAAFGLQVTDALANAQHHRETELGAAESTFLLQISQLLSSTFDVGAILQTLAEEASDLMEGDLCALYLYDAVTDAIELAAVQGATRAAMAAAGLERVPLARLPTARRAGGDGRPANSEWPAEGDLLSLYGPVFGMQASLTVPLRARDSLLGYLYLARQGSRRFTLVETQLGLKLGTLAALALDNARLYDSLTEQMRQVRAAQAQLIEAEKMASLGRIVAGVAHELNNPLAIVSGYAQVLLDGDVPPEVRADLERIDHGARRAAQVVRDLLAFARQQPIMAIRIDVGDMLRSVLQREETRLRESGIALELEIEEKLPAIHGDRFQLEQVLQQLVDNARHVMATHRGGGRLTVRAAGHEQVRLSISDDGPGIAPELIDKVFEPFLTTQEVGQGSGLGLSMCYGVVRAHGGHIWAANNPQGGATFYVEFPPFSA